jgi:hypothetical protein
MAAASPSGSDVINLWISLLLNPKSRAVRAKDTMICISGSLGSGLLRPCSFNGVSAMRDGKCLPVNKKSCTIPQCNCCVGLAA